MAIEQFHNVPTEYHGIQYRSIFESKVATILETLGMAFWYEPRTFIVNGVSYLPDFYVPSLNLWIEPRGYVNEKGDKQLAGFAQLIRGNDENVRATNEKHTADYLIFDSERERVEFHEHPDGIYCQSDDGNTETYLVQCVECNAWFFCGNWGDWHCRACGASDMRRHWRDPQYVVSLTKREIFLHPLLGGGPRTLALDIVADLAHR